MNTKKSIVALLLLLVFTQNFGILDQLVEDVVYTPGVAADKVLHPLESAKEPLVTGGDVVPVPTYRDYRSQYGYRNGYDYRNRSTINTANQNYDLELNNGADATFTA